MFPTRFTPSKPQQKTRLEGKPSMLPKPRRPGSTDRLSTEARRPSSAVHRSSSAEPPRATYAGGRLSREASATKLPFNARSRSQQGDRGGQPATTPLRSSYYPRSTTTPVVHVEQAKYMLAQRVSATSSDQQRTPTGERSGRTNWEASLDRARLFVTVKDQRPISTVAWQRATCARVQEALAARGGADGRAALTRPLTIARFVEVTGGLIAALNIDTRLNNDNYVTKLPYVAKRLLYPGTVSKSWLKTVNTLHAFPQALALIAYLLDLVNHLELPVTSDWFYLEKDDMSRLRREYLHQCWLRFQIPGHQFEDIDEEYLHNLKTLLGIDEEKIAELQQTNKKYTECLEDAVEVAARAEAAQLTARVDGLAAAARASRAAKLAARADTAARRAHRADLEHAARQLDADLERANAECQQLKRELERQTMSVAERCRLADEIDYSNRVQDSKATLIEQITKMVFTKENELALWQKKTLDSCVEYKQGLIHISAQFPDLGGLHIDEKELMNVECTDHVSAAVDELRTLSTRLGERRNELVRSRTAHSRQTAMMMEETRAKIDAAKLAVTREQSAVDAEVTKERAEAAAYVADQRDAEKKLDELKGHQEEYDKTDAELNYWETQANLWRSKLSEMHKYTEVQRAEAERLIGAAKDKHERYVLDLISKWSERLNL